MGLGGEDGEPVAEEEGGATGALGKACGGDLQKQSSVLIFQEWKGEWKEVESTCEHSRDKKKPPSTLALCCSSTKTASWSAPSHTPAPPAARDCLDPTATAASDVRTLSRLTMRYLGGPAGPVTDKGPPSPPGTGSLEGGRGTREV